MTKNKKMKIRVTYEASSTSNIEEFDTEDYFGYSDEEWNAMGEDERNQLLMEAVENNPPYWMVERVTEINY